MDIEPGPPKQGNPDEAVGETLDEILRRPIIAALLDFSVGVLVTCLLFMMAA